MDDEKRRCRQEELEHFEKWILEHPFQVWAWVIGMAVLVLEIVMYLDFLTKDVSP
jgi:hypothetical protein